MSLMVLVLPWSNSSFKKKVLAVVLLDSDAPEVIFKSHLEPHLVFRSIMGFINSLAHLDYRRPVKQTLEWISAAMSARQHQRETGLDSYFLVYFLKTRVYKVWFI